MTQKNKFEDINDRFASSGTEMTQLNKFKDRRLLMVDSSCF
jgi:hypothetical protein